MLAAQQPIRWQSQDYGASISGYVHVGKTTSNGLEIPFAISPVAAAVAKAAADEQEELELANIRDKIAHFAYLPFFNRGRSSFKQPQDTTHQRTKSVALAVFSVPQSHT